MTTETSDLKKHTAIFEQNEASWKKTYKHFLSFPSISTDPSYKKDILNCCSWLQSYLEKELNLETEIWETPDHPTLFAKSKEDLSKPTVLIYGHYDVQPIDPIEDWNTPPFEPSEREGNIYARGAVDDKGQIFYALCAVHALIKIHGELPCNIKFCIEGGEEIGSSGLNRILPEKKGPLKSDFALIVDGGIPAVDSPAITLGIRGITTFELTVKGSSHDLHSGTHGGVVYNPIHAITNILSNVRNNDGSINIPGFYDDVEEPADTALISWDFFETESYKEITGATATGGETKYAPGVRGTLRPTFEINGIWGGYIQNGFKTVIPSEAKAKFSCRLVSKQDPIKATECVKKYFDSLSIPGIEISLESHEGKGPAMITSPESELAKIAKQAYTKTFEKDCKYILMGGSIPITRAIEQASGADTLILGTAIESDLVHAPNEHFSWDRFKKGYLIISEIISKLGHR